MTRLESLEVLRTNLITVRRPHSHHYNDSCPATPGPDTDNLNSLENVSVPKCIK